MGAPLQPGPSTYVYLQSPKDSHSLGVIVHYNTGTDSGGTVVGFPRSRILKRLLPAGRLC